MTAWCQLRLFLCAKRPIERGAADVQKIGYILASFAFVDQLAGMVYLGRRKFHLPASMVIRSRRLRPSRSSFHTISVSRARSIFKHRERAGRFPLAPDKSLVLEDAATSGKFDRSQLQRGGLAVCTDASLTVFHPPILTRTYETRQLPYLRGFRVCVRTCVTPHGLGRQVDVSRPNLICAPITVRRMSIHGHCNPTKRRRPTRCLP